MKGMKKLTQAKLKKALRYNPDTGIWRREIGGGGSKKGAIAGTINKKNGYRYISVYNKLYQSSRLAFLYMLGYFPENEADHKNRVRDDDRWDNLREATRQCNARNCGMLKNNKTGVKGVYWFKRDNKWEASIRVNNKTKFLGYYADFYEAVLSRLAAEQCLDWTICDVSSSAHTYAIKNKLIRG